VNGRRLLVVTYYYPPQPGSGSNRWAAMVKYLRRLGHEVTVVTAAAPGHSPGASGGVVRTANLNANPLLRRLLLRRESTAPQLSAPRQGGGQGGVVPPLLWKGIVPDPWLVTWNSASWAVIRRELSSRAVDCLITSSPAESTHLLGLAFRRRAAAWIADFRDGWCFESVRPAFPTALQRDLNERMERRVVHRADAVVGVTTPIVEDFQTRLGVAAHLVTNGFDPELGGDEIPGEPPDGQGQPLHGRHLTFVHTGALSGPGPRGRDPLPLFRALRELVDDTPELRGRLQLIVAGRSEQDELALVRDAGVTDIVRHLGYLPRSQVLALQRQAGTLLLVTSHNRGEATGKLYEYMAAGRPIIALAEGNEAARIVAETNTGVLVSPDDTATITGALRAAISGELEREYAPRGTERYAYPALAEQMASVVETAIERRASNAG
jgi:glycosyltransferase involved in cell wall biosynthesis